MYRLFITVSLFIVADELSGENLRLKREVDEDRWDWGYINETISIKNKTAPMKNGTSPMKNITIPIKNQDNEDIWTWGYDNETVSMKNKTVFMQNVTTPMSNASRVNETITIKNETAHTKNVTSPMKNITIPIKNQDNEDIWTWGYDNEIVSMENKTVHKKNVTTPMTNEVDEDRWDWGYINETITIKNETAPMKNITIPIKNQDNEDIWTWGYDNETVSMKNKMVLMQNVTTPMSNVSGVNETLSIKNETVPSKNGTSPIKNITIPDKNQDNEDIWTWGYDNETVSMKNKTVLMQNVTTPMSNVSGVNETITIKNETVPSKNGTSPIKNMTIPDKNQNNEDIWTWGYDNEIVSMENKKVHKKNVTTPISNHTKIIRIPSRSNLDPEPSFCQPYNPVKPNFSKPGRRISEAKCDEYIWELYVRLKRFNLSAQCTNYRNNKRNENEKYKIQFVLGSYPTGPGEYPHMGAIGWKSSSSEGKWVFKCGSSLISEKFVLTAAHCARASMNDTTVADLVPKIVRLGDKFIIESIYNTKPPTDRNIIRIFVHPQYKPPMQYFDIALMELDKKVPFSGLLQPACLWSNPDISKLGKEATLTGWGVVETGSLQISPDLRRATVDVLDFRLCKELLRDSRNRNWLGMQDHQICAGKLSGGVDSCQGDSGGPLQVKIPLPSTSEGQMHYVFGVISFGKGCAHRNQPGIYTRVSSFIDWIENIVWGNQLE